MSKVGVLDNSLSVDEVVEQHSWGGKYTAFLKDYKDQEVLYARCSSELKNLVRSHAKKLGTSEQAVLIRALVHYFRDEKRKPRKKK